MHNSIRCHLWYRWPLTGEELGTTACQLLCNVSGSSPSIGWPACASGLSCPSISTPIYSLAASRMIFSCDSFFFSSGQQSWITMFHSYELPCGSSAIMYSHIGINIPSHRFNTLPTNTERYNNFCILIIIKHPSCFLFYFHLGRRLTLEEWSFFPPLLCVCVCLILLSVLSLRLLTTKQHCFLMNDHPRQVFIAFRRLHQLVVNRFCQGNVWS